MRFGKILLTIVVAGIFILLLSMLVVSPEGGEAAAEPSTLVGGRLLPLALPTQGINDIDAQRTALPRVFALAALCLAAALPLCRKERDANGRVLQALRYENSFHQLFRQEVAGG